MEHNFIGKWITDEEFYSLKPRNVFSRQLERVALPCEEHRNRHILFRKKFHCAAIKEKATLFISADDYYKVYINGKFLAQGPAPSYHFHYNYNEIDVTPYLQEGENLIAVHTLYQGLINRVWQSGDQRHGLILDLMVDQKTILSSDESFKTIPHDGYREMGICGYQTQFLEEYNSDASCVGFEQPDFDDLDWKNARVHQCDDHILAKQQSKMLEFEQIQAVKTEVFPQRIFYDFGSNYVGYLCICAQGKKGDTITIRCGQELNDDGSVRYQLRAKCNYEETWLLSEGESVLDQFDYKSFRYAELLIPENVVIKEIFLLARHYPFSLQAGLKAEYAEQEDLARIWDLCVHTQKWGVQEVIQDCMEREKGFYLGDGCYTALANMLLTGDDSMVRKLIDDAFATDFISDTLMTCMCCSFMQEIAEYPLMMIYLIQWHYRYTGDLAYLKQNYPKVIKLLEAYRSHYEKDGLLKDLDKWCVVEWPQNFRHGYDVDLQEGKVCEEAHVSLNAYYLAAVRVANQIADVLEQPPYREEAPLLTAFNKAFFDPEENLFRDGAETKHISLVGNCFVYGLGLCEDPLFKEKFIALFLEHGIHSLSLFCSFLALLGFLRNEEWDLMKSALLDEGAWKRILREDGTTTFEGWGKDTKWNTSLFHLTMSYASVFLANVDTEWILLGKK